MNCPHSGEDIGEACERACWLRHKRALGRCMAIDTGTTEVTRYDIARLRRKKVSEIDVSVERGREKIAAFFKLLDTAEDVVPSADSRYDEAAKNLMAALPLSEVAEVTMGRARTLVAEHDGLVREVIRKLRRSK